MRMFLLQLQLFSVIATEKGNRVQIDWRWTRITAKVLCWFKKPKRISKEQIGGKQKKRWKKKKNHRLKSNGERRYSKVSKPDRGGVNCH